MRPNQQLQYATFIMLRRPVVVMEQENVDQPTILGQVHFPVLQQTTAQKLFRRAVAFLPAFWSRDSCACSVPKRRVASVTTVSPWTYAGSRRKEGAHDSPVF
jgi:hypothetical protein